MPSTYTNTLDFKVSTLKAVMTETPGGVLSPIARTFTDLSAKLTISLKETTGNAAAGGGDTTYGALLEIVGAGTQTVDLTTFTDLAGRTARAFARYKFMIWALLSTAQGGNACSKVTVGNAATNANLLFLSGATMTFEVKNGKYVIWGDTTAAGELVDATHKSILITNNDASVTSKLAVLIGGGST